MVQFLRVNLVLLQLKISAMDTWLLGVGGVGATSAENFPVLKNVFFMRAAVEFKGSLSLW